MLDQGDGRGIPAGGAAAAVTSRWKFAEAELDAQSLQLKVRGQAVKLERKPLEILHYLLLHAGEVVTKEELLEAVWPGRVVVEAAVSTAIAKLRQALGDTEQHVISTAHGYGYRLLATVTREGGSSPAPRSIGLAAGDMIAGRPNWCLERKLGAGAYAEVWLAQHGKTRARRVFKFCGDGLQLTALKREVTLYRLLHGALGERADFVRLHDWNFETAPYFLECDYGGDDLPAWAEKQGGIGQVALARRLELAAQVADAVAAAHSAGVLHKDLKPTNILVDTDEQGQAQLRLTDFGAGSVLDLQRLDALGITRLGFTQAATDSSTGTPLYAAPEVLAGQMPTAQADVYALGVLLYQLVIGDFRKPLAPGWEAEVEDELLRQDIAEAAHGSPARRIASVQELSQRLRRLDARRDELRQQRLASARVAAAERELERARTRRPWVLGAVVALSLGMTLSLYFYVDARRARDETHRQLATVEAINRFLNDDLLAAADPYLSTGDLSLRQAAIKAGDALQTRFQDQPRIEAALRNTLGDALWSLSDYAKSEQHHRRELELYLAQLGPAARETQHARLDLVASLLSLGQIPQAETLLAEAETLAAAAPARDPRLQLELRAAQGRLLHEKGQYAGVVGRVRALLDDPLLAPQADERITWALHTILFSSYLRLGRYAEVEAAGRAALQGYEQQVGARHPRTTYGRFVVAQAIAGQGRLDEAAPLLETVRGEFAELLGPRHRFVTNAMHAQATVAYMRGRMPAAEKLLGEVYTRQKETFGPVHNMTLGALNDWSALLQVLKRYEQALALNRSGLDDATRSLGESHPVTVTLSYNRVELLMDMKRAAEAAPFAERLERHHGAAFPLGHPMHPYAPLLLGKLAAERGRRGEARANVKDAVQRLTAALGAEHADTRAAQTLLSKLERD